MRTSIDMLNYFRRRKQRKEIVELKAIIEDARSERDAMRRERDIARHELDSQKPFRKMYDDLLFVLENVDRYCALKPTTKIQARYPLQRLDVNNFYNDINKMSGYHYANLYTAEILIHDYEVEECIHFELDTGDGVYRYQYSKKGLAIQTPARILTEVTRMMVSAWIKEIHN
jgi:hypothetical protein